MPYYSFSSCISAFNSSTCDESSCIAFVKIGTKEEGAAVKTPSSLFLIKPNPFLTSECWSRTSKTSCAINP